jgi:hypothetical protein
MATPEGAENNSSSAPLPEEIRKDNTTRVRIPSVAFCEEKNRLLEEFVKAIHELNAIQNAQATAVIEGIADFGVFDDLIHVALEKKEMAKYAVMAHIELHNCLWEDQAYGTNAR